MDSSTEQQLANLFRETKLAHVQAFAAVDGEDPDWSQWYAEYLDPRLQELLGRRPGVETLAAALKELDAEHTKLAAPEPWPEFYARRYLIRYSV